MVGETFLRTVDARRTLGVEAGVSAEQLRRAYLSGVKASHPDRPGGDVARLRAIIEAYALLGAATPPGARSAPDRTLVETLEISPVHALLGGSADCRLGDGRAVRAELPPGLRHGDRVRIGGRMLTVSVRAEAGLAVLGDHLCVTIEVDRGVLNHGGRLTVETPTGSHDVWVSSAAGGRGIVRLAGQGLPARGLRPRGHLFVRLRASAAEPAEAPSRDLLRRFAAAWAA
jgi:curved DNA-binding protein